MQDIPNKLMRFFEREEYASDFISGQIRCGLSSHYQEIEDSKRRDTTENTSSHYLSSGIMCEYTSINSRYILCTSSPEADKNILKKKFGEFIVIINDPKTLRGRISTIWREHEFALNNNGADVVPIEYSKGEHLEVDESPPYLVYSQKHPSYREEKEFRYILTCSVNAQRKWEEHISLNVGDCSDICGFL